MPLTVRVCALVAEREATNDVNADALRDPDGEPLMRGLREMLADIEALSDAVSA